MKSDVVLRAARRGATRSRVLLGDFVYIYEVDARRERSLDRSKALHDALDMQVEPFGCIFQPIQVELQSPAVRLTVGLLILRRSLYEHFPYRGRMQVCPGYVKELQHLAALRTHRQRE